MRGGGALLVRRAEADDRRQHDQRGLVLDALRLEDRLLDLVQARVLRQRVHRPAVGLEALRHLLPEGEVGRALDRDLVVVVDRDQLAEAEVAGERGSLRGDALLHVAVAGRDVGEVVDDLAALAVVALGPDRLGEREADGVGEALAERAGRDLDARRDAVLGVAGAATADLAEVLDVVEAEVVAAEVQERVLEHAGVPAAEHEAVAVEPGRVGRVVAHDPREEDVAERRQSHRRAGVSRVRLLNGVHRQGPDRVDGQLVELFLCHLGLLPGGAGTGRGLYVTRGAILSPAMSAPAELEDVMSPRVKARGGIDLGGTKIQTVIVDGRNNVRGQARTETPQRGGPSAIAAAMAGLPRGRRRGRGL